MKDDQRIYGAIAKARDLFCIAVVEPHGDDPYTFMLTYADTSPQPWERVDTRRIINAVALVDGPGRDPRFVAVSGEGDVFHLSASAPITERIAGAGTYSDDATGLGATSEIVEIAGRIYVGGMSSQVYRRDALSQWTRVRTHCAGHDASDSSSSGGHESWRNSSG